MKRIWNGLALLMIGVLVESYAGGDIRPVHTIESVQPVEPQNVQRTPTPVYLGVGLVSGRYKASCSANCHYSDITSGAIIRAGYEYNQYLGIEARYIATFFGANELRGQEMQHLGLYLKSMYILSEDFNLYGLLGYGWTKTSSVGKVKLNTVDDTGFSAGIGLEYDLSDMKDDYSANMYYPQGFDGQADQETGWGLFLDYQRLLIKSNAPSMDIISGGVTYDF